MADIFDLASTGIAVSKRSNSNSGQNLELDAEIVIFPGVRYQRSEQAEVKVAHEKRTAGKSTLPSTST